MCMLDCRLCAVQNLRLKPPFLRPACTLRQGGGGTGRAPLSPLALNGCCSCYRVPSVPSQPQAMAGRRRRELRSRVLFTQPITPVAGQPVDIFYNPGAWLWTARCTWPWVACRTWLWTARCTWLWVACRTWLIPGLVLVELAAYYWCWSPMLLITGLACTQQHPTASRLALQMRRHCAAGRRSLHRSASTAGRTVVSPSCHCSCYQMPLAVEFNKNGGVLVDTAPYLAAPCQPARQPNNSPCIPALTPTSPPRCREDTVRCRMRALLAPLVFHRAASQHSLHPPAFTLPQRRMWCRCRA